MSQQTTSHLQTGMQNEVDAIEAKQQSIQPPLLNMETTVKAEGA
jgi:hypothetical protein